MSPIMFEFIFFSCIYMVLYTFLGYPMFMKIRSRFSALNVQTSAYLGDVSIVIVAHNEEKNIKRKLQNCLDLETNGNNLEIILVSDSSSDKTVDVANKLNDSRITILENNIKKGKSACVNQALQCAKSDLVLLVDVRQTLSSNVILELSKYFYDKRVGVVSGELVFESNSNTSTQGVGVYWKYEKYIRKLESVLGNVPGATGSIYMIRKAHYINIPETTLLDDVQIPFNYITQGYKVLFDTSAQAFDVISEDYAKEKNRKVRTLAGNYQLINNNPHYLLPYFNPVWIEFISHKVLRLIIPFFLLAIFISNIFILKDSVFYMAFFVLQSMFYLYFVINLFTSFYCNNKLYRIIEAFLNLNIYAVLGLVFFLKNKNATGW